MLIDHNSKTEDVFKRRLYKEEALYYYQKRGGDISFFDFFYMRYDDALDATKFKLRGADSSFRVAFNITRWYGFYKKIGHNELWCATAGFGFSGKTIAFGDPDINCNELAKAITCGDPRYYCDKELTFENDMECLKYCMLKHPSEHEYRLHLDYYKSLIKNFPEYIGDGILCGYPSIDTITRGFHNSDLIFIGARPSVGKTAFVNDIATRIAHRGIPLALFSLEQSTLKYEPDDKGAPIFIDDTARITDTYLYERTKQLVTEEGVKLVIVDYLQLMCGDESLRGQRDTELASIVKTLKATAKEFSIPIVVTSQLSSYPSKRIPRISDLAGYPDMALEANLVILIHRDPIDEECMIATNKVWTEFIIAKNDNGEKGSVPMVFDLKKRQFYYSV